MNQQDRAVTPVIAIILMVAVLFVLAAAISVSFFGVAEDINEPAPNVADTTGEFEVGAGTNEQIVRITHIGGDDVVVEEIEIIARASGPGVNTEARLVDLPTDSYFSNAIDSSNVQGDDIIDTSNTAPNQVIIPADSNTWATGETIQFRIKTEGADFREGESPEADELDIVIIHSPSNAILSDHTFRP